MTLMMGAESAGGAGKYPDILGVAFVRAIDGDTIEVELGPPGSMPEVVRVARVRVLGIDTPEKKHVCPDSQNQKFLRDTAKALKIAMNKWFAKARDAHIPINLLNVAGLDSFGRILADVDIKGKFWGAALIEGGFALPAKKSRKAEWCRRAPELRRKFNGGKL